IAACAHLLQGEQVAALMVHAGEPIADELFGDERRRIAVANERLLRGKGRSFADLEEHIAGAIGDPAVGLAIGVTVKGTGGRGGCVPIEGGELERLAVVIGGVTAAVTDRDRMLTRHLIEVVNRKRALVLYLGVVEEEAFHPEAWRRRARAFLELVDDAR